MTAETFLSEKLRRFNVIEYILVISTYIVVGLWIVSAYPPLRAVGWWFYLLMMIICVLPLIVHLISQPGDTLKAKFLPYVKSISPSLQMLLFLATFFLSCIVVSIFPIFVDIRWWIYLILILVLAVKPIHTVWFS